MSCGQFQSQLSAYHDGELDATAMARLDAHLQACASCAAELQALRAMSRAMQMIPPAEMSADAVARVHAAVDHVMDYSLLPLARSFIGIAASVLIVASAGLWFMRADAPASAPQPWEGAMLATQNADLSGSNGNSNGLVTGETAIEPDLIVADLSRTSTMGRRQ